MAALTEGVASLNRQRLECKPGKEYAELLFIGDVHYGSINCAVDKFQANLDYCLRERVPLFLMGDMLEAATRYSVGSGVYQQLSPQEQIEHMLEFLRPLAEAGLIVGYITGNHEDRITKETGIDVSKNLCRELKIPYLGAAGWTIFYVGPQAYTLYAIHGSSGSRFDYTKLKAVMDLSHYFQADIIASGHMHTILDNAVERQVVSRTRKIVEVKKCHVIVTGHYLKYDKSYAQAKGMPPAKLGSPKVKLFANEFDIHVSI